MSQDKTQRQPRPQDAAEPPPKWSFKRIAIGCGLTLIVIIVLFVLVSSCISGLRKSSTQSSAGTPRTPTSQLTNNLPGTVCPQPNVIDQSHASIQVDVPKGKALVPYFTVDSDQSSGWFVSLQSLQGWLYY